MSIVLTPGANTALPAARSVTVQVTAAAGHADVVVLLLDGDGKADGDNGVVLFSQPVAAGGAVSLDLATDTVTVTLPSLPAAVERVLVVAQADGVPDVSGCGVLTASVVADATPTAVAAFEALPAVATLQLVELYRRSGAWKVRSLGDGYAEGLAKLLTVHGVQVDAEPTAAAPAGADAPVAGAVPSAPRADTRAALPSPGLNMRKAEGQVSLRKGEGPILMTKTPLIRARVWWESGTDYDVYALVLMRDGTSIDVAAFEAVGTPVTMEHAGVKHLGDVRGPSTSGVAEEILEIRLTPDVLAVVPVAYSAISNGTGSFQKYKVSLEIDNGAGTKVTVPAENGNKSSWIFTCVPGVIKNTAEGVVIDPLELYSRRTSEKRPIVRLVDGEVVVTMDKGATNLKKKKVK